MKNYYEEKIQEIKDLLEKKDYSKADNLLQVELAIPYIPSEHEIALTNLSEELNLIKKDQISKKVLTNEEISKYLLSNQTFYEAIALEQLKDQNIRNFSSEIKIFLEDDKYNSLSKCILFELLYDQSVNENYLVNGVEVNPLRDGSLLSVETLQETIVYACKAFPKQPQIIESLSQEIEIYFMKQFPKRDFDPKLLSHKFINIFKYLYNEPIILDENEKEILDSLKS